MRSFPFVLAVLIGTIQSSAAHATTPAERTAAFHAMRNHITKNLGSLVRPEALASMLKQVDRAEVRSKTASVSLTKVGGAMLLETRGKKGSETLEMRPAPSPYGPERMSIWTFDATHSTHGRLQLERVLHYGVDTWGAVNKTDELGVWRGNVQVTSFEGRGEGFKNTQGHIYW